MGQNIFKTTNILVGAKTVLSGDTSWQVSLPFVLEILFLVGVFCFVFFFGKEGHVFCLFFLLFCFLAPLPGLLHLLGSKSILRIFTNRKPGKEGTDTVIR